MIKIDSHKITLQMRVVYVYYLYTTEKEGDIPSRSYVYYLYTTQKEGDIPEKVMYTIYTQLKRRVTSPEGVLDPL